MKTTHTHKGVCQVCGLVHAVDNKSNLLAKHGYTVSWGFFNGICDGADNLPLQLSRSLVDSTIDGLLEKIATNNLLLADIWNWKPELVYGFVDSEGNRIKYKSEYFYDWDIVHIENKNDKWGAKQFIRDNNKTVVYELFEFIDICSSSYDSEYGYYKFEYSDFINEWRIDRKAALVWENQQMQNHIEFLKEQIDKYHGKPLFESNMVIKVIKELTQEAAKSILDDKGTEEIRYRTNGSSVIRHSYDVWESEASKEINGHTLTIKCSRNTRNYNGYLAYTYLDGKKVAKKKLEEVLG